MEAPKSLQKELPDQPTPEQQARALRLGGITGAIGGLLLLISMFLPWYQDDLSDANELAKAAAKGKEATYNAFQGLERTDIGILILALLALAVAGAAIVGILRSPGLVGLALSGLGVAAAGALLLRASDTPAPNFDRGITETTIQPSFYLAVVASLVILAGGAVSFARRTRHPPEDWDVEN